MTFRVETRGFQQAKANLERLEFESPARARQAVNRAIGVARIRSIKAIARRLGVPQRVIGGRKGRRTRDGRRIRGAGYVKQVRARRRNSTGALVGLIEGIRFGRIPRQRLGAQALKPGGIGRPFQATLRSGHDSFFERVSPQKKVSAGAKKGTRRYNLPIREVVIPTDSVMIRVMRTVMRRAARSVYPQKVWEELQKSIRRVF